MPLCAVLADRQSYPCCGAAACCHRATSVPLTLSSIWASSPTSRPGRTSHSRAPQFTRSATNRQTLPHTKKSPPKSAQLHFGELKFRPTTSRDDQPNLRPTPSPDSLPTTSFRKARNLFLKKRNRQHGSRIRLELAPAHLRQGLPRLVGHHRISTAILEEGRGREKEDGWRGISHAKERKRGKFYPWVIMMLL